MILTPISERMIRDVRCMLGLLSTGKGTFLIKEFEVKSAPSRLVVIALLITFFHAQVIAIETTPGPPALGDCIEPTPPMSYDNHLCTNLRDCFDTDACVELDPFVSCSHTYNDPPTPPFTLPVLVYYSKINTATAIKVGFTGCSTAGGSAGGYNCKMCDKAYCSSYDYYKDRAEGVCTNKRCDSKLTEARGKCYASTAIPPPGGGGGPGEGP